MTRWHKISCNAPFVIVEKDQLRCSTCKSDCTLQDLASSQNSANDLGSVPPDEPPGQLNLWWPPSVPYSDPKEGDIQSSIEAGPDIQHESGNRNEAISSPVYGDTLGKDQFRLACLSPPEHNNSLVHLSLEIYEHTNCPEYETVSYTWGGEEGDNTPSRPVFVGPYWDIMFHTNNCWEMLRSIRPWRGIRMVWVDAFCINQNNPIEQGQQVAKMRQIYEECIRVIVYLGPDAAIPLEGRFPRRCRLEELDQSSPSLSQTKFTMDTLLQRRYFSRVWVIQELVASQRAIMRIGDADFSMIRQLLLD